MQNWWEQDTLVSPANDPGFTGVIPGVPKPEKPKEPPSGYVGTAETGYTPVKGGPADPYRPGGELDPNKPEKGDAKAQESERKAGFLTTNVLTNVNVLNNALKVNPEAAAPTWGQVAAGLLGQDAKNAILPAERQVVENAQRLIVDNLLTLGTGAAYTAEQIEAYRRGFFPQVGDTPEAIEAKRQSLRGALLAARQAAGNQAPQIDQAMQMLGLDPQGGFTNTVDGTTLSSPDPRGTSLVDKAYAADGTGGEEATVDGSTVGVQEFTAEQKQAYEAFWKANPKPSPEQLTTFLAGIGITGVNNAADIIAAVKEGRGYSTTEFETDYRTKVEQSVKQERELGLEADPVTTLATQGASLNLTDEAAGVGGALANIIASPLTGDFDPVLSYRIGRDAEKLRIADARQQLGYGGTAIEFAGALASMGPGAAAALAPKEAARQAGRVGAVGGALSGFGAGEGAAESLTGAAGSSALGYGIGRYGGSALEWALPTSIKSRTMPTRGLDPRLGAAAEAEGVTIVKPMLDGKVGRRAVIKAGRSEADPSTAAYMQERFGDVAEGIEAGVGRLGRGGQAKTPEAIGNDARAVAQQIMETNRIGHAAVYDAARAVQPTAKVDLVEMRQMVDAQIARLSQRSSQNKETINALKVYRADLDKPLPLQEVRDMRTDAWDNMQPGNMNRSSEKKRADRFMVEALKAADRDIRQALTPEAQAAWDAADAVFKENSKLYEQAIKPIFGDDLEKLTGEQIYDKIRYASQKNGRALRGFYSRIDTQTARDMAATIAEGMGRNSAGEFSAMGFVRQAAKMSPSARETFFGPSGAASIDNLTLLARRLERAQRQINRSKTARPVIAVLRQQAGNLLGAMLGGGTALSAGPAAGAGVGVVAKLGMDAAGSIGRGLSARALMNPRVTRWMADAADVSTPQQAKELKNRLGGIIAREPAVAHELQPFYDLLEQSLPSRTPAPLAAESQGQGDNDDR